MNLVGEVQGDQVHVHDQRRYAHFGCPRTFPTMPATHSIQDAPDTQNSSELMMQGNSATLKASAR